MKRNTLLMLSVLAFGLPATALAEVSTFPADAEASYDLPAIESYAERMARLGDEPAAWGVSRREVIPHDPFPFGGGIVDD